MKYVDMHCDTLYKMLQKKKQGEGCSLAENDGHIDLVKLKKEMRCFKISPCLWNGRNVIIRRMKCCAW